MTRAAFRPCIDLHDGKVKQIVGGTLQDSGMPATNFVSALPPAHYAELYRRDGLTGGHVIQLGKGNDNAAKEALATWRGGLQIGGGVTAENAASWLDAGAAKVIVTSYVFHSGVLDWERLQKLLEITGKDQLVLDLSCRKRDGKYYIVTDRWQTFTEEAVTPALLEKLSGCASEFLIHAVDVEGKRCGIDRELLGLLAQYAPIDCVYAGGIASWEDIAAIEEAGQGRIHYTVGSALDLFGGTLSYEELVRHSKGI